MPRHRQRIVAILGAASVILAAGLRAAPVRQGKIDPNDAATVPRITLEAFQALQSSGKALVVDVRDEIAFAGGHIPSAVNVPLSRMEERAAGIVKKAGSRPIVIYCSCPSEHSSAEAGLILYAHDARDVRALVGGYVGWVKAGGKVNR